MEEINIINFSIKIFLQKMIQIEIIFQKVTIEKRKRKQLDRNRKTVGRMTFKSGAKPIINLKFCHHLL